MQVNLTVNIRDKFLESCSVSVTHRVTAIYRAVIYRFDCKPLSGLLVCWLIISLAERLSSKFYICPRSFTSQPNIHFSLCGHYMYMYQATYQPPEGLHVVNG